jgi:hypothetical protein
MCELKSTERISFINVTCWLVKDRIQSSMVQISSDGRSLACDAPIRESGPQNHLTMLSLSKVFQFDHEFYSKTTLTHA